MGGMSFFDRKEVRDILAYLKVLAHPTDEVSLLRIINVPTRVIGQTTVKRLMEEAVQRGKPLWEVLTHASELSGLSAAAVEAVDGFRTMIGQFHQRMKTQGPTEIVKSLIREVGYRNEIVRQYPNADDQEARWASVEQVVNAAADYSQRSTDPTIAEFLNEVALTGNDADEDKDSKLERNAVALMTMHAAKGLEFPEVYIVGMEEGTLPHHRSIADPGDSVDEERRLCYVGVTRAQRRLTLTLALNRRKWGKSRPTIPSRFLYELTGRADNPNYLAVKQGRARPARSTNRPH
jgi:DNA helicase-2/ATP-dependent DNA helicase PcrA